MMFTNAFVGKAAMSSSSAGITTIQCKLVRRSFGQIATRQTVIANLFFDRMFELNPSLRILFKDADLDDQSRKLMRMIALIVRALDDLDSLTNSVQAMARRHIAYGVRPSHFATFGEALIWAIDKGLGPRSTPNTLAAWRATYDMVAAIAIEGMQ